MDLWGSYTSRGKGREEINSLGEPKMAQQKRHPCRLSKDEFVCRWTGEERHLVQRKQKQVANSGKDAHLQFRKIIEVALWKFKHEEASAWLN